MNKKDFDNLVDILMGRKKLPLRTLTNILQNPASNLLDEALEVIGMHAGNERHEF